MIYIYVAILIILITLAMIIKYRENKKDNKFINKILKDIRSKPICVEMQKCKYPGCDKIVGELNVD